MKKELKIIGVSLPEYKSDGSLIGSSLEAAVSKYPFLCGNKLVFNEDAVDNRFSVSLYGSGNTAVINTDGVVTQPLEDMEVNLFYRITDSLTGELLDCDNAVRIRVGGLYSSPDYRRPRVIPSVREWCGFSGEFSFSGRVAYNKESFAETAGEIAFYIEEYTGKATTAVFSENEYGDIAICVDESINTGEEGYLIEINDICRVVAGSKKGFLYAAATIAQMICGAADGGTLQKGIIRDYPQYSVRGIMIDTARYYMNIKYLEEVVKYAGFFKINRVHLHLNDGAGETENSFRLESEVYPELNKSITKKCAKGNEKIYKKDDFIKLEEVAEKYGVEIVPEIDAPSHCGTICAASRSSEAAKRGFGDASANFWQLDLRDNKFENSVKFVQDIIGEYIGGDSPVFRGGRIHIGTDEWIRDNEVAEYGMTTAERNEKMRKYMDEMIRFINSKGYTPVLWNGMNSGEKQYAGKTPVSNKAEFQTWSLDFSDIGTAFENKYPIINSNDSDLYIVPGVTYYKNDLDIKEMFENWDVGKFGNKFTVDEGHPLLLGTESAIWLDASCGSSHIDIFKLLKNQIMLITEKGWYGCKNISQNGDEFSFRVDQLANYAACANPGRFIPSDSNGVILSLIFDGAEVATDISENGNNAIITGAPADGNDGLQLTEKTKILLPLKTVANPFTLSLRINIASETPENAVLFGGTDGTVYVNYHGTQCIAFERKGYTYIFDGDIPKDKITDIVICCDERNTYLTVDGVSYGKARLYRCDYEYIPQDIRALYTLQLPLEKLFEGIAGRIYSLEITKTLKEEQICQ